MHAEIRPFIAADNSAWLPLWLAYQRFYEVTIPSEVSAMTWARLLDAKEPMGGALAWDGNKAVGLVHYLTHRSCWTIGDYCYLQDLYVDENVRGGGIGRALIEHVYGVAKLAGCSRVYWLTKENNVEAMKLYERIADRSGFIQYRKLFVQL